MDDVMLMNDDLMQRCTVLPQLVARMHHVMLLAYVSAAPSA